MHEQHGITWTVKYGLGSHMTFTLLHFTWNVYLHLTICHSTISSIPLNFNAVHHGSSHHFSSWSGSKLNQLQKQLMERGMDCVFQIGYFEVMFLTKGIRQAKCHILPAWSQSLTWTGMASRVGCFWPRSYRVGCWQCRTFTRAMNGSCLEIGMPCANMWAEGFFGVCYELVDFQVWYQVSLAILYTRFATTCQGSFSIALPSTPEMAFDCRTATKHPWWSRTLKTEKRSKEANCPRTRPSRCALKCFWSGHVPNFSGWKYHITAIGSRLGCMIEMSA